MRLYLSSVGLGPRRTEVSRLLRGGERAGVILNAYDFRTPERRAESLKFEMKELSDLGLEPEEVDLRNWFGDPAGLEDTLRRFDLLYVRGGSVFVLRRALAASGADRLLPGLLAEDAFVYSGYSAGICVLGPTLRGIEGHIDDPSFVPDGYPDTPTPWDGLGVLPYAIAPHYRSDHPESAEIERSVTYFIDHHIPFVALRDGESIVVDDTGTRVVS
ncbi:Type 1 glutamine amidotransferase-like domain-containing protein [Streptomyces odontomachi]|uniref:Type 1 glutamine amidotransferase-like domain-containing protein n=1 Tax=Streptomyces odontomachi TaxID=2944940 RepID=UPI00210CAB7A|nr:Type 1 glutamine amidotransferase-like domain-containing protein [Streptomyces sp. ODS25]